MNESSTERRRFEELDLASRMIALDSTASNLVETSLGHLDADKALCRCIDERAKEVEIG